MTTREFQPPSILQIDFHRVRDRDRSRLSSPARSDKSACLNLLHCAHPLPRYAPAPECRRGTDLAGKSTGSTAPYSASPHYPEWLLKSEIEIGPVYHRLPDRIRAHASICFMALILYRVMRQRLHAADAQTSPEKALAQLRRIQHHRITLNGTQPNAGLSTTSKEQTQVLAALNLAKPSLPEQLTLL